MIGKRGSRIIRSEWSVQGRIGVLTLFILALAIVTGRFWLSARSDAGINLQSIIQSIVAEHGHFSQPKTRLIIVANIEDLTCPPCFDDFIALAESLSVRTKLSRAGRVVVLLTDGRLTDEIHPEVLKHWAGETGLSFPNVVVAPSLLDASGLRSSQAVLIDPSDHLRLQLKFPLGDQPRAELLALIERPD